LTDCNKHKVIQKKQQQAATPKSKKTRQKLDITKQTPEDE